MNNKLEAVKAAKVYYKGVNDLRLIGCLTTDGALGLETIEVKPIFDGDQIPDLEVERKYPAKEIVREFIDRHQRRNVLVSRGRPTRGTHT